MDQDPYDFRYFVHNLIIQLADKNKRCVTAMPIYVKFIINDDDEWDSEQSQTYKMLNKICSGESIDYSYYNTHTIQLCINEDVEWNRVRGLLHR